MDGTNEGWKPHECLKMPERTRKCPFCDLWCQARKEQKGEGGACRSVQKGRVRGNRSHHTHPIQQSGAYWECWREGCCCCCCCDLARMRLMHRTEHRVSAPSAPGRSGRSPPAAAPNPCMRRKLGVGCGLAVLSCTWTSAAFGGWWRLRGWRRRRRWVARGARGRDERHRGAADGGLAAWGKGKARTSLRSTRHAAWRRGARERRLWNVEAEGSGAFFVVETRDVHAALHHEHARGGMSDPQFRSVLKNTPHRIDNLATKTT